MFGVQARHHATGGRLHGTAVRLPYGPAAPATLPSSSPSPESRKVHMSVTFSDICHFSKMVVTSAPRRIGSVPREGRGTAGDWAIATPLTAGAHLYKFTGLTVPRSHCGAAPIRPRRARCRRRDRHGAPGRPPQGGCPRPRRTLSAVLPPRPLRSGAFGAVQTKSDKDENRRIRHEQGTRSEGRHGDRGPRESAAAEGPGGAR